MCTGLTTRQVCFYGEFWSITGPCSGACGIAANDLATFWRKIKRQKVASPTCCVKTPKIRKRKFFSDRSKLTALENPHGANRDLTEGPSDSVALAVLFTGIVLVTFLVLSI